MFGRKRRGKEQTTDAGSADFVNLTGLNLATDDRFKVGSTITSDALAFEVLAQAQAEAKDIESGQEVTVEIAVDHSQRVHHMELSMSLMSSCAKYGLYFKARVNNSLIFIKVT